MLEESLKTQKNLSIPKNVYAEFYRLNVNYHMVYDKKFCKDVIDKMNPDVVLMSKLVHNLETGNMRTDTWDFEVKIYNSITDVQRVILSGENMTSKEIKTEMLSQASSLGKSIAASF